MTTTHTEPNDTEPLFDQSEGDEEGADA